jgi:hypothetical protein
VITLAPSVPARFAARASLPPVALGLALLAAPAHAEAGEGWGGWTSPPDVDMLEALLLLVGIPLLLFVLITLAVYLPAMVRGEDVSPTGGGVEDQWLGGPRPGARELASGESEPSETGGARGSW